MNVSSHRLSDTEIEFALVSHAKVAKAAVVGATDETTRQAVCAFVILRESAIETGGDDRDELIRKLHNHVTKEIGAIPTPRRIIVVSEPPDPIRHDHAPCCVAWPRTATSGASRRWPTRL